MFVLLRAVTYATIFVSFFLVFLPTRVLVRAGIEQPPEIGPWQVAGMIVGALGAQLVATCVTAFVVFGRGTPAPFDPPRKLVVRGPYRIVRNPMYIGAFVAILGVALFYQSIAVAGYALAFLVTLALFVRFYEEPTLRQQFGAEYDAYTQTTGRWIPKW